MDVTSLPVLIYLYKASFPFERKLVCPLVFARWFPLTDFFFFLAYDLELSDKISHLTHETLKKILTLVPLRYISCIWFVRFVLTFISVPLLGSALKEQFPHKRNDPEVLFAYTKHLLLVSYYAPSLIEPILTTAVDRLIQIDVRALPIRFWKY